MIKSIGTVLGAALLISVSIVQMTHGASEPQAESDRETVSCMVSDVTHEDKAHLAQLNSEHDIDSVLQVFDEKFGQCIARSDQSERKGPLMMAAWHVVLHDAEFEQMRTAGL